MVSPLSTPKLHGNWSLSLIPNGLKMENLGASSFWGIRRFPGIFDLKKPKKVFLEFSTIQKLSTYNPRHPGPLAEVRYDWTPKGTKPQGSMAGCRQATYPQVDFFYVGNAKNPGFICCMQGMTNGPQLYFRDYFISQLKASRNLKQPG